MGFVTCWWTDELARAADDPVLTHDVEAALRHQQQAFEITGQRLMPGRLKPAEAAAVQNPGGRGFDQRVQIFGRKRETTRSQVMVMRSTAGSCRGSSDRHPGSFNVELRAAAVAARDDGRNLRAILRGCDEIAVRTIMQGIGMDEIAVIAGDEAIRQQMGAGREVQRVPAHMRQAQTGICGFIHAAYIAGNPAQTFGAAMFEPVFAHELHADADAQERRAIGGRGFEHVAQCGAKALCAVGKSALSGKDQAVGIQDVGRITRDDDVGLDPLRVAALRAACAAEARFPPL